MDLSSELLSVLEKAKREGDYYNPWILSGVLNSIREGDPNAEEKISEELDNWVFNMFSR